MALLPILRYPDPRLRKVAKPVAIVDDRIRKLVHDMAETMYEAPGVGLAATQVDVHERVVVIDISDECNDLLVLINPEIQVLEPEIEGGWEGCLSVPGLRGWVERPAHIRYRGLGLEGEPIERVARGFHARVVQHECDHLDGRLYPSRMADLNRLIFESEIRHFQQAGR